jgi:gas vesicle protein
MSMTNPGDRSAAEIEREVEETRARLTGTVEQIKERVSPNQVAEQAMDWLRGSGGKEFLGNLGTAVRDNPVPIMLVAAGIGWLALSGNRRGSTTSRYEAAPRLREPAAYPGESYPAETYSGGPAYDGGTYGASGYDAPASYGASSGSSTGGRVSEAASGLRDQAGNLVERVSETANRAWDSVTGAASSLAEGASSTGQGIAGRANQAWSSAADRASGAAYRAGRYGSDAGQRVQGLVEAQPLLLGALGLALGAALGAMLPKSEAEDRLMGESRDRVAGQIQELAGDAYQQARETATEHLGKAQESLGEVYGRTREKLAENGVDPQAGVQALGEVARDLRETVERTAQEAASSARAATKPGGTEGRA